MSYDKAMPISEISPLLELNKMLGGVVRSSATAIGIAQAILAGLYDEGFVNSQSPFSAEEQGDVWVVRGHSPDPDLAAIVVLAKSDGRVMQLEVRTRMK